MHTTAILSVLFPVVLIGVLLPFFARTRRGILFGVTLPLNFIETPTARTAIQRYRRDTIILALAAILLSTAVVAFGKPWTLFIAPLATFAEVFGALILWLRENRALRPHATAVPLERNATLTRPSFFTSGAFLAALASSLPLAFASIWLHLHWASIPARWPQHWDAAGRVNGWGTSSAVSVYGPQITGAVIILLMLITMYLIARAPGTMTKRRSLALAPLAGLAWLMSGMFALISLLPLKQGIRMQTLVILIAAHTIATLAVIIWLLWRTVMSTSATTEPYDGTPDAKWHFGLVYFNPADSAVLVPKRFGIGWTFNYARPLAWVYTFGILILALSAGFLPLLLKHPHH